MTGAPDEVQAGTGLTWFALQRLPPLLEAFEKEIPGVRAAEDIEYIHRMRVASRRLRAALPLFRACFPPKQHSRWMREIGAITRALGDARDLDVQTAFLVKYKKKSSAALNGKKPEARGEQNPFEPAITYLLQDLRKRRKQAQTRVLSALDDLEKSRTVAGMHAAFSAAGIPGRRAPVRALARGIPTTAALRIGSRLAAMGAYEPWVTHPDAVAEHHAMRIAAKKLRYTLEVYGPVYRLGLKKAHARVKKVQEILGDLHDCDVWIDHVTRLLLRERNRLRTPGGEKHPNTTTLASLRLFLKDRERQRTRIHRQFVRYWNSPVQQRVWDELRQTLISGRMARFVPVPEFREQDASRACEALAATYPDGLAHHRTVTRLALMLFDSHEPDLALSRHYRSLLEYAGMLHDIGLSEGERDHNVRSSRRIFSDESLPLDIADRSEIGLIAFTHRGRIRIDAHPLFALLRPERQKTVLVLAAILRVADGLDYLHTGVVQEVHCVIGEQEITCNVISSADVSVEKERARRKAGLFVRACGRELVIP